MPAPGDLTEADAALIAELAALGIAVSARQLRRWRDADLIPSPIQVSAGRGHGRRSVAYPEGTVVQAAAVARAVAYGVRLDQVVMTVFVEGGPVSERQVRDALGRCLDEVEAQFPPGDDPADRADALALEMARQRKPRGPARVWFKRSGSRGARRTLVLEDGIASLMHVAFGGLAPARANINAIATVFGLAPDPPPDGAIEAVSVVAPLHLRELLKTLSWQELAQARDAYHNIRELRTRMATDRNVMKSYPAIADWQRESKGEEARAILTIAAMTRAYSDEWLPNVRAALTEYRGQDPIQ